MEPMTSSMSNMSVTASMSSMPGPAGVSSMNVTTGDHGVILERLNNERAGLMLPVIILLVILMITGLLGNIMVCYYYGWKTKRTTNSIFIVVLAIFDIITCSVAMPIEIVDLRFFYKFENGAACKLMRFVNHFAAIGSALTLLAIAIDRYRRICRPFKKQLSLRDTKIASITAVLLAVLFSWPSCVFYDAVKVTVTDDHGQTVVGSDCTTTKHAAYRTTLWLFNGLHLTLFVISVLILVILYSRVGHMIVLHSRHRRKYSIPATKDSGDQMATDSSDLSEDTGPTTTDTPSTKHNKRKSLRLQDSPPDNNKTSTAAISKSLDIKTVKYSIIMLVITIVFIVSFLPYLILVIWRIFLGRYEGEVLSDAGQVAFQFGIRSYMLNSVINPITYGFFNSKFTRFFYTTLCPCCSRRSGDISSSSSGS